MLGKFNFVSFISLTYRTVFPFWFIWDDTVIVKFIVSQLTLLFHFVRLFCHFSRCCIYYIESLSEHHLLIVQHNSLAVLTLHHNIVYMYGLFIINISLVKIKLIDWKRFLLLYKVYIDYLLILSIPFIIRTKNKKNISFPVDNQNFKSPPFGCIIVCTQSTCNVELKTFFASDKLTLIYAGTQVPTHQWWSFVKLIVMDIVK